MSRYQSKAIELGVTARTVQQRVSDFNGHGEAGLVRTVRSPKKPLGNVDQRWIFRKIRSCPGRATTLVQAVMVLIQTG